MPSWIRSVPERVQRSEGAQASIRLRIEDHELRR
jgi:hypothetical protein